MKKLISIVPILLFGACLCLAHPFVNYIKERPAAPRFLNRIEGIVWSPDRQPVSDVYVELQNELGSSLSRLRTSSSGRFSFTVANAGTYVVKVLSSGTNYLDYTESIELVQVGRIGSDSVYLDVYLKIDKRKLNIGLDGITEAVFVQEVPDNARKLYKNGLKDAGDGKAAGLVQIEQAITIFPNYFDALSFLGRYYVQMKDYQKSLPYLVHAIDINQRSFSGFYALAYACYQLGHKQEAKDAARAATIIQPSSYSAQLLYGTVLRVDGSYDLAEKALLAAKSLSKDRMAPDVHKQLALLYNKLNRNKEAADELELYLKNAPEAPDRKEMQDTLSKLRKASFV